MREAGKRALQMRHFDVQLIGGMALHNGKIAEMRTGEGKTLVATLPGVPQRARRQRRAHRHGQRLPRAARRRLDGPHLPVPRAHRRRQPVADGAHATSRRPTPPTSPTAPTTSSASTTCATTWCSRPRERVQRGLTYAIVDEVDSILIDEARTPLIISGQADDNVELYYRLNELAPKLTRQTEEKGAGDYWVDEKAHQVLLSEEGHEHAEQILGAGRAAFPPGSSLYDAHNIALMHHLYAALRAHALYPPRPALRRAERRGGDRRRVHRPADVRAAAGPTACTRRSRRRKACRSSARTRRSRRSRSRTTSACTASSPA